MSATTTARSFAQGNFSLPISKQIVNRRLHKMKKRLLLRLLATCLCWIQYNATSAPFVVLDDSGNGFYASSEVPEGAIEALKEAKRENNQVKAITFAPSGDWVVLMANRFLTSDQDLPICHKLTELQQHGCKIKSAAFGPGGYWTVLFNRSGSWVSAGGLVLGKIREIAGNGGEVRSVSYGPEGSWIVLYGESSVAYHGVPDGLAHVLENSARNKIEIQCVAFSGQDWICLGRDALWASNTNLPAFKIASQEMKQGLHPRSIAFVPDLARFNAVKFGAAIHQTFDGKLAGGYECEVINHGKIVVSLAGGWARAPWEKVDPDVKMTVHKPMDIASVSKTVTAVAMLKLCEECAGSSRQFSLDEPFWPHMQTLCPIVDETVKKITIRQLLTHRSGLTNEFKSNLADLNRLLAAPLGCPPGAAFHYLNVNYYIIHLLIQQISQMDYSVYVKRHVLVPMGITEMETHGERSRRMCCYGKLKDQDPGDLGYADNASWAGPMGWYASAADLGKFLEGIRQNRVLHVGTTAMMLKQNIGWDFGDPWGKVGVLNGGNGRHMFTGIVYFNDGVEAVLMLNCERPDQVPYPDFVLIQAWKEAHG